MATAWDVPRNPLTDPVLDKSLLSNEIRWGYRIFTDTPNEARKFTPGRGSCNNCHLNAGQRERALPLVVRAVRQVRPAVGECRAEIIAQRKAEIDRAAADLTLAQ